MTLIFQHLYVFFNSLDLFIIAIIYYNCA